jgi:hypothetical protein
VELSRHAFVARCDLIKLRGDVTLRVVHAHRCDHGCVSIKTLIISLTEDLSQKLSVCGSTNDSPNFLALGHKKKPFNPV